MFNARRSPDQMYRQVDLESAVESASPHRLIELLFEGADQFLASADAAMTRNDIPAKAEAIGRALRIVEEGLKAVLDMRGGEIAGNLRMLYEYMCIRLLQANLRNDRQAVAEARGLLAQIAAGWRGIAPVATRSLAEAL